jgi:hypothetical protein
MADLPGRGLARALIERSREESRRTPMEDVIQAASKYFFSRQIVDDSTHEMLYKPVDAELCRWACTTAKGDLSDLVLGREIGHAALATAPGALVVD